MLSSIVPSFAGTEKYPVPLCLRGLFSTTTQVLLAKSHPYLHLRTSQHWVVPLDRRRHHLWRGAPEIPHGSLLLLLVTELKINEVGLLSISKGPGRKAEYDQLWRVKQGKPQELILEGAARLLMQEIRDEAHRFAITGHKKQKMKRQKESILKVVPGVGAKRQRDLLKLEITS